MWIFVLTVSSIALVVVVAVRLMSSPPYDDPASDTMTTGADDTTDSGDKPLVDRDEETADTVGGST